MSNDYSEIMVSFTMEQLELLESATSFHLSEMSGVLTDEEMTKFAELEEKLGGVIIEWKNFERFADE